MVFRHSDLILDIILQENDLEDGSEGPRLDFKMMQGCVILLYQQKGKPFAKFSKQIPAPNPEGYMFIEDVDGQNGEIRILVPRRITKTLVSHKFYMEVLASDELIHTDAEDNRFYSIASGVEVALVQDSVGRNITIPE